VVCIVGNWCECGNLLILFLSSYPSPNLFEVGATYCLLFPFSSISHFVTHPHLSHILFPLFNGFSQRATTSSYFTVP
jgi:hypothetical protein